MARGDAPVTKAMVRAVINELLAVRTPPGKPISDSPLCRFRKDRPEFHTEPKVRAADMVKLGLENQTFSYVEERHILCQSTLQQPGIALAEDGVASADPLVPIRQIVYNAASY